MSMLDLLGDKSFLPPGMDPDDRKQLEGSFLQSVEDLKARYAEAKRKAERKDKEDKERKEFEALRRISPRRCRIS